MLRLLVVNRPSTPTTRSPRDRQENRARVYTLLVRAHDQIRRATHYLRWDHGDADDLVPSLYAGRRRKDGDVVEQEQEPAPAPATQSGVTTPVAPATSNVPVGMPGAAPFAP